MMLKKKKKIPIKMIMKNEEIIKELKNELNNKNILIKEKDTKINELENKLKETEMKLNELQKKLKKKMKIQLKKIMKI